MLATCNRLLLDKHLDVTINDINVNQVNSSRYLGIYPDSMLNWWGNIKNLCKWLAPKVRILWHLKTTLSRECLLKIYQCIILSVIDCCIAAWRFAPSTCLNRVQSLQNCAARIITGNYDRNVSGKENAHKYLGVSEGDEIQHSVMKGKTRKEFYRRIRLVIKSELSAATRSKPSTC